MSARGVEVSDIISARQLKHVVCPELDELLDEKSVKSYSMRKTYDEAAQDVFLILHSSGTTGLPKSVPISHAMVAANDHILQLGEDRGCGGIGSIGLNIVEETAGRMLCPFAPFHMISIVLMMCFTVFGKTTYVCGLAERSMTPADVLDIIEIADADVAFCASAILEKYSTSQDDMGRLHKLKKIIYGGGKPPFYPESFPHNLSMLFPGVLSSRLGRVLVDAMPRTDFCQFFVSSHIL
jgi:acyl-CoA synthetase (AMP-forming)/AMP-acid ligase II